MDKTITISCFTDYINIVNEISDTLKKDYVRDDILLFRGHSDTAYELIPSVARIDEETGCSFLNKETELISKAIGKNPNIFYEDKYAINLLVKLQHFGIPTRLLDVTYNALVALYFACKNDKDKDKDGEVFVFKVSSDDENYIKYFNNPYVDLISKTYKKAGSYPYDFREWLGYAKYQLCYMDGLTVISYDSVDNIIRNIKNPIFISPVELSERQKNQQGAFIIFPNEVKFINNEYYLTENIHKIEKDNPIIAKRISIPSKLKAELLKYLENYGIREEFLFPDSPDIICKTIKENALKWVIPKENK